ncbi:MAG: AAA family ATPase [Alteromonadaceae bacterium]|nr:AAA family ATPase [Alteromonadaceae bacterium]
MREFITQSIRVTRVYQLDERHASFSGVPLQEGSHRIKSAKRIVYIKTKTNKLQVAPVVGQHWTVEGKPKKRTIDKTAYYKIYETHFTDPEKLECTLPDSPETFALFIGQEKDFNGITEDTAREIWINVEGDIYKHLHDENEAAFSKFLSPKKIKSLFKGFKKYKNLKHAQWFTEIGIPLHIQQRLLKYHDEKCIELIKENPYLLSTFGMKFDVVDRIARKNFAVSSTDSKRLISAFETALRRHENKGHTVALRKDIKPKLEKLLNSEQLASQAFRLIKQANAKKTFIYDTEHKTYQSTATYIKEKAIALRITHLATTDTLTSYQRPKLKTAFRAALKSVKFKLALGQIRAIYRALRNPVMVVNGGGGTGKTTVLKCILAGYKVLGIPVHCAALSGRAAKRMNESTNYLSTTIARLLRESPIMPNQKMLIKPAVLVLDESSMIDVDNMFRLINHLHPDTRILFVGDSNQLPPIGFGLILNDIINSGIVTVATLNIVQRQECSTGIPEYSQYVAKGIIPPELSMGNVHFHWVKASEIEAKCVELYQQNPDESRITAAIYDKKRNNFGGIEKLNEVCQQALNPDAENLTFELFGQFSTLPIKLNDPVIFTKNNMDAGIQNGTLGKLVSLANGHHFGEVLLDDSDEDEGKDKDAGVGKDEDEGKGVVELTQTLLESIKPAYAMSLHKAQGSQFKRVIVPINSSTMIDRNWLYTAITRAEEEVHLVGPKIYLEAAIERQGATLKRKTALAKMLKALNNSSCDLVTGE